MKSDSASAIRRINDAQSNLSKNLEKLASGKRINRASDDAAGLAIADSLNAVVATLTQAGRNASDSQSAIAIADSAMGEIGDISTRLKELSTQASNGTLSDEQRTSLNNEYQQLTQEIQRISQTTEFNGKSLLGGEGFSAQVGKGSGAESQIQVEGVDVSGAVSSVASQDISTQAGAQAALGSVDSFIASVSSARGNLGSASSRIEVAEKNISVEKENAAAAESRIRDVDVAEATARKVSAEIQSKAAVAVLAQANQSSKNVFDLLK